MPYHVVNSSDQWVEDPRSPYAKALVISFDRWPGQPGR